MAISDVVDTAPARVHDGRARHRGNGTALLKWSAPTDNGGLPVTGYVVTPHIAGVAQAPVRSETAMSQFVNGLTNGKAYTFTVPR